MIASSWTLAALLLPQVTSGATTTPSDPVATPWPVEFVIDFETNITTSADDGGQDYPIGGVAYYNWNLFAQRIDHDAGSYECTHFYNTDQPCTLYFLSDGQYRVLSDPLPPDQEKCCLDMPGIGPSPPDWASRTHPSFIAEALDSYSQLNAYKWAFDKMPNTTNPHYYEEVSQGELVGRPLYFSFPAVDGRQDFHYNPQSLKEEPQPASIFALPDGCEGKLCSTVPSRNFN